MNELLSSPEQEGVGIEFSRVHPAKVSLQYLFVWTTAVAALLAIGNLHIQFWEDAPPVFLMLPILASSVVYGACLATWLFAWKRYRGEPVAFPVQPGHWLALLLGIQYAGAQLSFALLYAGFWADASVLLVPWSSAFAAVAVGLQGTGWIIIYRQLIQHRAWKLYAAAMAAWCASYIIETLGMWLLSSLEFWDYAWLFMALRLPGALVALFAFVIAIVAIVQDLRRRRAYDWLHWIGVGTIIYIPTGRVAVAALSLLARQME